MPPAPTRQIIVLDLKHIKSGTTSGGEPYTLRQVRATKLDGIPIDLNLRTFDDLPKDIPITVTVEKFSSQRGYGDSYTIKLAEEGQTHTAPASPPPDVQNGTSTQLPAGGGVHAEVGALRSRVEKLEADMARFLSARTEVQTSAAPPPPPPSPAPESPGPEQPQW